MKKLLLCTVLVKCIFISLVSCENNPYQLIAGIMNNTRSAVTLYQLAKSTDPSPSASIFGQKAVSPQLSEPCNSHYNFYQQSLLGLQTWALKVYDSSTKFPPYSLLQGAFVHLGNFDECIDVRDIKWNNDSVFHGQYCLASYSFKDNSSETVRVPLGTALLGSTLKMAQCVPSSCSMKDAAEIAKTALSSIESNLAAMGVEIIVNIAEGECQTAEPVQFTSNDMIATAILCVFGGLVIFSTCYDVCTKESESRSNLAMAFSVYSNGQKLLATTSGGDLLHCLHGIRFLSMAWVILGHRYVSGSFPVSINTGAFVADFFSDWKRSPITNASLSVDTFFLLSGLLVAYVFFRTVRKTNSFNVPVYYIHRYVRLTPALAIMIMLRATLLTHSGSGPLWSEYGDGERIKCENNWWVNLLYVQNYVRTTEMCIVQSWYLAVDMQLYWFAPLLLVPLWKWPRIGQALSGLLMIVGCVITYLISYSNIVPIDFMEFARSGKSTEEQVDINYPAYTRFVPYVIGITLGYVLVDLKEKGRKVSFSKITTCALWIVTLALLAATLFTNVVFQQNGVEFSTFERSIYAALFRPGWALGVSFLIFLCATGHGGFINTLLSWNWFQPLSRLTYSSYLVHVSVQQSQFGSLRSVVFLNDMTIIPDFLGDLFITLPFAAGLSLVFESPFIILEKAVLGAMEPAKKIKATPRDPNDEQQDGEGTRKLEKEETKLKEP